KLTKGSPALASSNTSSGTRDESSQGVKEVKPPVVPKTSSPAPDTKPMKPSTGQGSASDTPQSRDPTPSPLPVPPKTRSPASIGKPTDTGTDQNGNHDPPRSKDTTPSLPPAPSKAPPVEPKVAVSDPPKGKVQEGTASVKNTTDSKDKPLTAPKPTLPTSNTGTGTIEKTEPCKVDAPASMNASPAKTTPKSVESAGDHVSNADASSSKVDSPKNGTSGKATQSPAQAQASFPTSDVKTGSTKPKQILKLNPPKLKVPSLPSLLSDPPPSGQSGKPAKPDAKVVEARPSAKVSTVQDRISAPVSAAPSKSPSPNPNAAVCPMSSEVRPQSKQCETDSAKPSSPPQPPPSSVGKVGTAHQQAATPTAKTAPQGKSWTKQSSPVSPSQSASSSFGRATSTPPQAASTDPKKAEAKSQKDKVVAAAEQSSPSSTIPPNPPVVKDDAAPATTPTLYLKPPKLVLKTPPSLLKQGSSSNQEASTTNTNPVEGTSPEDKTGAKAKQPSPSSTTPPNPAVAKVDGTLTPTPAPTPTSSKVNLDLKPPKLVLRTPPSLVTQSSAPKQNAATTSPKTADGKPSKGPSVAEAAKQPASASVTSTNTPIVKQDTETATPGTEVNLRLNPPKLSPKTPPSLPTQSSPPNHDGKASGTFPALPSTGPSPSPQKPFDTVMGDSEPSDVTRWPPGPPGVDLGHTDAEMTDGPNDDATSGNVRSGDDVDMGGTNDQPPPKVDATGTDMDGVTATMTTHIPQSQEVEMNGGNESNVEHQDGNNANDTDMTDNPNPIVGATDGKINAIDASSVANRQAAPGQLPLQGFNPPIYLPSLAPNPPIPKMDFNFANMTQPSSGTRSSSWDSNDQDIPDTRAQDDLLQRQSQLAAKNEKCWDYREKRNLERIHTRIDSGKRQAPIATHHPVQNPTPQLPSMGTISDFNSFGGQAKAAETTMKRKKDTANSWGRTDLNHRAKDMRREEEEDEGESEEAAAKREAETVARAKRLEKVMNNQSLKVQRQLFDTLEKEKLQLLREKGYITDSDEEDDDYEDEDEDDEDEDEEMESSDDDGEMKNDDVGKDEDEEMESDEDDEGSDSDSDNSVDITRLDKYELDENGCFIADFWGWKKKAKT
ncbi:MAG: hypothetical protein Q9174_004961, partial [Haloplaca sp. 1 TL-2023]